MIRAVANIIESLHNPNIFAFSDTVAAAKKKGKKPMISKLVLDGPKIYGSLVSEMIKNQIGANLTSLTFKCVKVTNQTKLGDLLHNTCCARCHNWRSCTFLMMSQRQPAVFAPDCIEPFV